MKMTEFISEIENAVYTYSPSWYQTYQDILLEQDKEDKLLALAEVLRRASNAAMLDVLLK